jgi:anti-sigma B factor antagonist
MPDEALAVHESDVGEVRLLEVFGELDLATAPKLCSLLDAARIQRVRRLVVDLTGVDFCDSTGLRALMGATPAASSPSRCCPTAPSRACST